MMGKRRWVVLLAALVTVAVTARLGFWQLDRAAQKQTLQQARDERQRLPALPQAELARDTAAAAAQWQRAIELEGRWMPEATVYLDNRTMNGRVGFFVVTPLVLDDGRAVLVQRGWLPRDRVDRHRIAPYRTAEGRVQLRGRIAPEPSRLYELGSPASGVIRQNLSLAEAAREIRRPLAPVAVIQESAPSPDDGLLRQWPQPASDVHKHYGYAFQWFGLSALALLLYVWFQIIQPRRRAR